MNTNVRHLELLAKALGMNGLSLDGEGILSLAIGERVVVHIQADEAAREFVLYSVVGHLPENGAEALLVKLMQANRFWRDTGMATLSLDESQPARVLMARRLSWVSIEPDDFPIQFKSFVDHASDWSEHLINPEFTAGEPAAVDYAHFGIRV